MKRVLAILLLLLGVVEIFWGVLWGRMGIYAHEASLSRDLRVSEFSAEQVRALNKYIDIFQNQWHVVAWFGAGTVVLAIILYYTDERYLRKKKVQPNDEANLVQR